VPFFAAWTTLVILSIPSQAIDHQQAKGFVAGGFASDTPMALRTLLACKPLAILAAVAALFHFANAAMLPLLSPKLALAHAGHEAALTSGAIMVAQLVMIPMSLLVARADWIGRKPLLVLAVAALVVRGLLFTLSENAVWLLAVQALDGVGIGLFDALLPLMLADIMRGSGRYNLARGLLGTVQGVGGSLSQAAGGLVAAKAGYDTALLMLAGVALLPLFLIIFAFRETR
jgi:MFS family permease